ncbi:hypothetical protein [Kribbella deserti]|uniref:Uncharacterized protein n=1 Tax=Kribbella deserti TaxID=1926257 RepID=A0ABV6QDY7_9ACTN
MQVDVSRPDHPDDAEAPPRRPARWTIRRAIELVDRAIDAAGERMMRAPDPPEWTDGPTAPVSRVGRRTRPSVFHPQISAGADEPAPNRAPSLD